MPPSLPSLIRVAGNMCVDVLRVLYSCVGVFFPIVIRSVLYKVSHLRLLHSMRQPSRCRMGGELFCVVWARYSRQHFQDSSVHGMFDGLELALRWVTKSRQLGIWLTSYGGRFCGLLQRCQLYGYLAFLVYGRLILLPLRVRISQ